MEYKNYNNVINNLGYGNVISNDNYITGNFIYQNKDLQNAEALQTNDVREDHVFLDNLLDQFDEEKKKEIIENLISDRVSLNRKMKSEIENIKDHLRSMKSLSAYQINPVSSERCLSLIGFLRTMYIILSISTGTKSC